MALDCFSHCRNNQLAVIYLTPPEWQLSFSQLQYANDLSQLLYYRDRLHQSSQVMLHLARFLLHLVFLHSPGYTTIFTMQNKFVTGYLGERNHIFIKPNSSAFTFPLQKWGWRVIISESESDYLNQRLYSLVRCLSTEQTVKWKVSYTSLLSKPKIFRFTQ